MLQETFKEEALNKTQVYKQYSRFKGGKRTSQDLADLEPTKMMKIFKKFTMQIVVRPLMRFLRERVCLGVHVSEC